mmetsp:Transcript_12001/g.21265  ORF Transcript_12001/g.21265 Transcript_12001/m.21265 type:complete len:303 (-) Transcript_12001:96-1004(-)|eukprot:CAMPEP_0197660680 /NCGR_PEP_ID=MMETSP1338-20131121/51000_1 /TAXON_ID=43686 ORGANISM="Pelagodinium beii, Strain RCC1491" /NCGR_SAMPLE_ID=MMETSP1338 /ASSEMBLY_ACC=CAM_ASM_000754 /LENGTH=302 /DNA_ID=CAMNT_0043238089 /DNA_START=61 /DNA_END=969 /DNA_ORIENTATION=+
MVDDKAPAVQAMKALFQKFDEDGDGTISPQGLAHILRKICKGASARDIAEMVREADKNHNRVIEYQEFIECLFLRGPAVQQPKLNVISEEACMGLWAVWWALVKQYGNSSIPAEAGVAKDNISKAFRKDSPFVRQSMSHLSDEGEMGIKKVKLTSRLQDPEVQDYLDKAPETVKQDAFVHVVWPKLKSAEKIAVGEQLKRYYAQAKLSRLLKTVMCGEGNSLTAAEIRSMFDEVDVDGNGILSVKELVQAGDLDLEEATSLTTFLDQKQDGMIEFRDVMEVVGMQSNVRQGLKGMFASSQMN